jgi:hypothetical protein
MFGVFLLVLETDWINRRRRILVPPLKGETYAAVIERGYNLIKNSVN